MVDDPFGMVYINSFFCFFVACVWKRLALVGLYAHGFVRLRFFSFFDTQKGLHLDLEQKVNILTLLQVEFD